MLEENKKLVLNHINLSWNQGRLSLLKHLATRDFIYDFSLSGECLDYEGFSVLVKQVRDAIPELEVTVEEIIAEGNKVVTQSTFCGTQEKALFGFPASYKIIAFSAMTIWDLQRGKVQRQTTMIDMSGLQKQFDLSTKVA